MFLSFIWCKGSDNFWDYQIKSHLFLNKMYFYCFLPSLSTDFTDFTDFFVIITGRTRWTRRLAQCIVWLNLVHLVFFLSSTDFTDLTDLVICVICVICWLPLPPIQELGPGATPCRGGRCAARYPHGPQQPKTKILRLWLVFPPMELNHRKGRAGRRMG